MRSIMNHNFSMVPRAEIQRSSFDRSHGLKTTFDASYLIPVFCDEVLPGDTFNLHMNAFARLATPIKPVMDNMFLDSFFFYVPLRLIWTHFQNFMGEKENPDDTTEYLVPKITGPNYAEGGIATGSLGDYMGLPVGTPGGGSMSGCVFSAFWFRAYNLIWNEWFRDQNLQDSVPINKGDTGGDETYSDYVLLKRGKRHDYFTSCLPWPQKGPDILLPLGQLAPVQGLSKLNTSYGTSGDGYETGSGSSTVHYNYASTVGVTDADVSQRWYAKLDSTGHPQIYANLENATAATINELREAFQLQKLFERDARGGTRYTEIIRSHFGVISPDARLQRPEYLGGGSTPVNIHPIAQTSASPATPTSMNAQGNLAAFGTTSINGHGFVKSFTEHGVILGLVSVRADLTYQQGLNRMWTRETREEFYWPELAHIGEQAVLNSEIFWKGIAASDDAVFGYQERYAEYRYKPSLITGKFRSNISGSLDYWHLSQDFADTPELGADFIEENPPIARVVAVNTEPQFLFDAYFNLRCARPMPVYSVPGWIDHF